VIGSSDLSVTQVALLKFMPVWTDEVQLPETLAASGLFLLQPLLVSLTFWRSTSNHLKTIA